MDDLTNKKVLANIQDLALIFRTQHVENIKKNIKLRMEEVD